MMKRVVGIGAAIACVALLLGWLAVPNALPWLGRIWRLAGEPSLPTRLGIAFGFVAVVFVLGLRLLKHGPL
jgi:hypothetical protein